MAHTAVFGLKSSGCVRPTQDSRYQIGKPSRSKKRPKALCLRPFCMLPATGTATLPTRTLAPGVYTVRTPDGRTTRLVVE